MAKKKKERGLFSSKPPTYNELSPLKSSSIQQNKKRLSSTPREEDESLSIFSLYRFASRRDKIFMALGIFLAVIGGAIVPLLLMELADLHQGMVTLGLEHYSPYECTNGEEAIVTTFATDTENNSIVRRQATYMDADNQNMSETNIPRLKLNMSETAFNETSQIKIEFNDTNRINTELNDTNTIKTQFNDINQIKTANSLGSVLNETKFDLNHSDTFEIINPKYSAETLKQVHDAFLDQASRVCIRMSILAFAQLLTLYSIMTLAGIAASRQGFRMRAAFLRSLLHQDIAWFDAQQQENFAVRIIRSLDSVQEGIGERVTLTVLYSLNAVAVLGTACYYGWNITLVIGSSMPLMFLAVYVTSRIQIVFTRKEVQANSTVGSVAEETLSGIKTVYVYGAQAREADRYNRGLREVYKLGCRLSVFMGLGGGITWFLGYATFGMGLWYGSHLVLKERCQHGAILVSDMLAVILCVLNASISISQAARNFDAFSAAKAAAVRIFQIIDRVPVIDSNSESGLRLNNYVGRIRFQNVFFHYPLREDVAVLRGLTFTAEPGQTVALVGSSGCGKSTVIQLLQRFYDTVSGQVFLDDVNVRDLNVGWLRSQIGLVGQEPVLFEATIGENIALGQPEATEDMIKQAAITAGAHDFIMKLPEKYSTMVGEKGAQMSGGQKQRIAIARALVRNPKILLLDEATSALDSMSESTVQAALDQARKGRTTLVIAHRLSTIRNADRIIVIKNGQVAETGKHSDLMARESLYYQYVISQNALATHSPSEMEDVADYSDEEALSSDESSFQVGRRRRSSGQILNELNATNIRREYNNGEIKSRDNRSQTFRFKLIRLAYPEWHFLLLGFAASVIVGMCLPYFLFMYAQCVEALTLPKKEGFDRVDELTLQLLGLGAITGVSAFFQTVFFGQAGERQTMRLKMRMFLAMLSKDVAWYDDPENASGALCASLTTDAVSVQEATVGRLRNVTQAVSTLVTCICFEIKKSPNLALLAAGFLPIIVVSTQLNKRVFGGTRLQEKLAEQGASKTAVEAIRSIRTVASLHRQDTFIFKFVSCMQKFYKEMPKMCHFNGLTYGLSQSTMAFACVAVIYYGVNLILDGTIMFSNVFETVQSVIISIVVLAEALATMPDYSKSSQAAERILKLISSNIRPKLLPRVSSNKPYLGSIHGNITFRNVHFGYPLRPDVKVLRGFDLKIKAGQTVALVGTSGCGKSTCVSLIERFYSIKKGDLLIDGKNILDYNIDYLRSQIGLVSQEPVLFGISIAKNIAYGDSSGNLTEQDIMDAAKTSNIHNFVTALPEGYETCIGGRESWLSGGEKQRVAIARALVRNPKILLLDEATSALDTESEKIVQAALDQARQGRTCIVIAHRLSTIQNADQIVVIHEGTVVERGKHYELLAKKGFYYKIYMMQAAA